MALEMLIAEAQGMSEDSIMEVLRFMKLVKTKAHKKTEQQEGSRVLARKAGKYRGKIRISDDFDAPLEEFAEYM